jgi:hypothetical protein
LICLQEESYSADNAHWSSDVFVASAIGYFTGKVVVTSHDKQSNPSFVPLIDGKDIGILIPVGFSDGVLVK